MTNPDVAETVVHMAVILTGARSGAVHEASRFGSGWQIPHLGLFEDDRILPTGLPVNCTRCLGGHRPRVLADGYFDEFNPTRGRP